MKLINKDALIAGLEDWQYKIKKGIILVPLCGRQRADAAHEYEVIGLVKEYIDAFETKEVQEEPISKDLEEASKKWLSPQLDKSYASCGEAKMMELTHFDGYAMLDAIEFGAKWKEEQYKKNLLDVCKKQTEEEAEIERDFIEGIIDEHRLPTFDDAIKYGMRLQKEQFEKEHTKNCGNVEYEQDVYPPACQPWFTPDQAKKAVEIAREEIYKWLANHYRDYMHNPTGEKLEAFFGMDMITDLKQAMKDE